MKLLSALASAPNSVKTGGSKTRSDSQETQPNTKHHKVNSEEVRLLATLADKNNRVVSGSRIEVHPDWLQFAGDIQAGRLHPLIDQVEQLTKEVIHLRPGKPVQGSAGEYQHSGRSLKGVRVAWDNQDEDGKCRCLISIPGKVLSAMEMLDVRTLALELLSTGLHCTRLDIAIDDFGKRLSFLTVVNTLLVGNYSKFKNWDFRYSKGGGTTIYFGSRESARCTKLYDKSVESKGKINAYRLETKFGSKTAQPVLLGWLMIDPDELSDTWETESARYLMKSVVGSINFIDRGAKPNEKNLSRLPRLEWWEEFVDMVGGEIYHTAPVVETSLKKSTQWHKRSTLRSLVCILKALEKDAEAWFLNQMEEANASLNAVHHHRIKQFRQEWVGYESWTADRALGNDFDLSSAA
jgi:hypothetical protein